MDRIITATEANQRFSEMLRDVQSGESFVVTSRGEPVARMTPVIDDDAVAHLAAQGERIATLLTALRKRPFRAIGPWTREDLYK